MSCLRIGFLIMSCSLLYSHSVQAIEQLKEYKLTCSGSSCHSSVAGLVSEVGICTAFLVNEDTVITNNHCIPENLKTEGASCEGKIKFVFPEMLNFPKEEIGCKTIKRISDMKSETISIDVAIIRLQKPSTRKAVEVNFDGLNDGDEVRVIKINPNDSGGEMIGVTCFALQNSLANPFFKSPKSPLFLVRDCQIVRGNSGSPMFNKAGQVVGVISAVGSTSIKNMPKAEGHISLGTNLGCYRDLSFTSNFKPQEECRIDLSKEARLAAEKKIFEELSTDLQKKMTDRVNKELVMINGYFHKFMQLKWVETRVTNESKTASILKVGFEPECFFPHVKTLREYDLRVKETSTALNYSYEEISGDFELNEYLVPEARIVAKKTRRLVTLNTNESKQTGEFIAKVFDENGQKLSEKKLPFCGLKVIKN